MNVSHKSKRPTVAGPSVASLVKSKHSFELNSLFAYTIKSDVLRTFTLSNKYNLVKQSI